MENEAKSDEDNTPPLLTQAQLEKKIESLLKSISTEKKKVCWIWATSGSDDKVRLQCEAMYMTDGEKAHEEEVLTKRINTKLVELEKKIQQAKNDEETQKMLSEKDKLTSQLEYVQRRNHI